MTFLAPAQPGEARVPSFLFGRKPAKPQERLRFADEDSARRALGGDGHMPVAAPSGTSLEHLARIALG